MSVLNQKAAALSRHARTGKDGAIYSGRGNLLATVETFTAQTSMNNAQFNVLGSALEFETAASHKHTIQLTHVICADDGLITDLMEFFSSGKVPNWTFQGVVVGNNGSEERIVYKNCIPSGNIDIQNIAVGDVIKRNWSIVVNSEPVLQKKLTI